MSSVLNKDNKRRKHNPRHVNQVAGKANMIGHKIFQIRKAAKIPISQDDLAGRLASRGILLNRSAIAKIEAGTRSVKDFEVHAIAKALKVEISKLFE